MEEDRVVLIRKAEEIAIEASRKYKNVKGVLVAYCEVGIETAKLTRSSHVFDAAILLLKNAEEQIGDADISKTVTRLERRMDRIQVEEPDLESEEIIDE